MKLFAFVSALASLTAAAPNLPPGFPWPQPCISQVEANIWVQNFIGIVTHQYTPLGSPLQTAEILISNNFTELSNSILSLQGLLSKTSNGVSAPNKQAWIQGVLNAPAFGGVQSLTVAPAGCNQIIWYWRFNDIGSGKYPIKGFNLFTLQRAPQLQVTQLAVEFDSIAWSLNTGEGPCH